MTSSRRCVHQVNLRRAKGYLYFIDKQGDISRTRRSTGHYREKHPHEKVWNIGLRKRPGYWYFLDKAGNIIEQDPNEGK